jgi:hypothetical protein
MSFVYVLSGWEGSAADACVYHNTRITDFNIPPGKYYLADAGFGACDELVVPYRGVCYHLAEWGWGRQAYVGTYYSDLSPYYTSERTCIISRMIRASGPWAHGRNILDYDGWAGKNIIPDGGGWAHIENM